MQNKKQNKVQNNDENTFDAVVVGAGFAGLYMLYRLQQMGLRVRVYEAGGGIGGTWYWNRYPGARCDIPSMEYSYQFSAQLQQEWQWRERYATQPELLRYAHHVADRFELWPDIQLSARVNQVIYDETARLWQLTILCGGQVSGEEVSGEEASGEEASGEKASAEKTAGEDTATAQSPSEQVSARFVIMATGCLSVPNMPDIAGLDSFRGPVYHTGQWPHEGVDFSGQKVGVIGTGSSAIQSIPLLAEQAESLTVFQRTPNYSIPAHNGPLAEDYVRDLKARYPAFRAENWQRGFGADFADSDRSAFAVNDDERQAEYEERWARGGLAFLAAFNDLVFDAAANDTAREFISDKIQQIVDDPKLAALLTPATPVGCKRLCVDTDYFATYNRDHVRLVDVNQDPIKAVTDNSVQTRTNSFALDCLVLATGFDAMTGALSNITITGSNGQTLTEKWAAGPRAYLGLATSGFPNLFLVTGPGSPSVLSNMLPSIEHHVNWIADCINHMQQRQLSTINAQRDAEEAWLDHVNEVADQSVYPQCNSWYLGANVPGKKRVFMPYLGVPAYVEKCRQVVAQGYRGFVFH